ncbi:MAG: hypothetical protein KJ955_03200 [Nanoarchaeota archaeon]|nr:hypothetical protein [Nanoarchaeota archaeon]
MEGNQENLEETTEKYYEFKPNDFIPISGMFRYNRRSLNGYLDDCKAAGKKYMPSLSAKITPRRTFLMIYSIVFVMGAAKFLETYLQ